MPRQVVERVVCYEAYSGVGDAGGGCSYENHTVYDDWDECARHLKEALDADLRVMVEPTLMTPQEYAAEDDIPPGVNPLLGEPRAGQLPFVERNTDAD
jgi:hypothetical protein